MELQARKREFLDPAIEIKADPLTIGRQEWLAGSLGAGKRPGLEIVDAADVESLAIQIVGEVDNGITVT